MHSTMAHHPLTDAPLDPEQQFRQLSLSLCIELDTIWYGISLWTMGPVVPALPLSQPPCWWGDTQGAETI